MVCTKVAQIVKIFYFFLLKVLKIVKLFRQNGLFYRYIIKTNNYMSAINKSGCYSVGGVERLYYTPYDKSLQYLGSTYKNALQLLQSKEFYLIEGNDFTIDVNSATETDEWGRRLITNNVSFTFSRNDAFLNRNLDVLGNKSITFIFIDNNYKIWIAGIDNGYKLVDDSISFGVNSQLDRNKRTLSFVEKVTDTNLSLNELEIFNYIKFTEIGNAEIQGIDFIQSILNLRIV